MNIMKDKILSKSWIKKFLRSFYQNINFKKLMSIPPNGVEKISILLNTLEKV